MSIIKLFLLFNFFFFFCSESDLVLTLIIITNNYLQLDGFRYALHYT